MRQSERPSEELYEAMVSCRTKALVFMCVKCRKLGSIAKRLLQHEYKSAHVEDEQLVSVCLLEEKDRTVVGLQAEIEKLRVEKNMYEQLIQIATVKEEPTSLLSAAEVPSV